MHVRWLRGSMMVLAAALAMAAAGAQAAPPVTIGAVTPSERVGDGAVVLAQSRGEAQPQEPAQVRVKSAILRAEPDGRSRKLTSLRRGLSVQVLDTAGEWAHVRVGKREGYIARNLLTMG